MEMDMREIRRRRGIKGMCAVVIASAMLCGCTSTPEESGLVVIEHETENITYEFVTASVGEVVKTEKVHCVYHQMNEQAVSFDINGKYVDQVYVKEGDSVKKGTLLATLSSKDLERRIEDLQYSIARAELQLAYLDTNEANDISEAWVNYLAYTGQTPNDADNTKERVAGIQKNYRYQREDLTDALESDKKTLANLKTELRSSKVYADIDGVVYKLKNRLRGTTSKAGEVIMTIMDTSECLFETQVPNATEIFREGETHMMQIAYGTGAGTYELIPYQMENWGEKQQFEILDGPESSGIEVGTSGTMSVITQRREDVLCVPSETIHKADDKAFVYVLSADNMKEVKWVEIGLFGDTMVEIMGGLAEGEKVIRK